MNTRRLVHTSSFLLTALLTLSGCVLAGQLDESGTESASGGSEGSASTRMDSASTPSSGSSGALESGSSFGEGGFVCADYTPPPFDCESAGTARPFVGYSSGVHEDLDDTECMVERIRIRDRGDIGFRVDFDCPTGSATLHVSTRSPEFSVPFTEGESVLLTIRTQASSSVVRTLSGELLLAYVEVLGFESDVDLGTIEIVPGLSGCPAEPAPFASCTAGGSVATQRISLKVASGVPTGASVFEGQSAIIDVDDRPFLLIVGVARETVCWDDDCTIDDPYPTPEGAMSFLLAAQPF